MYNSGNSSKNVTGASIVDGTVEAADLATAVNNDIADGVAGKATADLALPKAGGTMTGTISDFQSVGIDDLLPTSKVLTLKDGAVGIGTTSPVDSQGFGMGLDIQSSSFGSAVYLRDSSDTTKYFYAAYDSSALRSSLSAYGAGSVMTFNVGTGASERLRILESGGLTFNGDTAAANALDDYEEGAWTPEFFEDGSAVSGYTVSSGFNGGWYTKIGNLVTFGGMFRLTNRGSPGSGDFQVGGLPYPTTNISPQGQSKSTTSIFIVKGIDNLASDESYQGSIQQNVSYIAFYAYDNSNGTHSSIVATDVQSDVYMQFSGSYQTT
jgi:hypothetical protein